MATDTPWQRVERLSELNGDVVALLATIDDLRRIWDETLALATPGEVEQARKRSLRRHAIETGVIERLYDLDWGVTEALVAEGLTLDAATHEGGIAEDTLTIIRDQYSALEYLADAARSGVDLTLHFIRELHVLITRHQPTFDARDQFGRIVKAQLPHGAWKTQPNHAVRNDGSIVEFAPPHEVQFEMDSLLDMYRESHEAHPIVRAAWLHHRFIMIHPFADGNGRVARALTLLVLLQAHYAPLVVDRRQRADYIAALESGNSGDLRPLVRMFARLEGIALRSELIRPVESVSTGMGAAEVARAYAERLRSLAWTSNASHRRQGDELAHEIQGRLTDYISNVRSQFLDAFKSVDPATEAVVYQAKPPDDRAHWWRAQLVRTANAVDFYTNLLGGSWWTQLKLTVFGLTMRYVVAIQKVGRGDTGVLAVTSFAEAVDVHAEAESSRPASLLTPNPDDSVTLLYSDSADARWPEIHELADRTLAAAIAGFSSRLG